MAPERLTRPLRGTIADQTVELLRASGVRRIHGLPGDSLNGLTDALARDSEIAWRHVRHEEAAAFAASGEAGLTGELAVCTASCGPGNLHLINGLFDAQRSRVPVLAIAAHIPRVEIGGGYFQETHPQELFRECSLFCEMVSVPEQLPRLLEIAMRAAVERRGVAVLVVPGEIFLHERTDGPAHRPMRLVGATPIHPQLVAATIDRLAADDTIFLADVGTPVIWAARYLRMTGRRRLLGSFIHGRWCSTRSAPARAAGMTA